MKLGFFIILIIMTKSSLANDAIVNFTCQTEDCHYNGTFSCCIVKESSDILQENTTISFKNSSNSTYEGFEITGRRINYFPTGLENLITNLKVLYISHSGLMKITKNDLQYFKDLEHLNLAYNIIEFLEENLFTHNTKLLTIDFSNNKIKLIHPTVFDGLTKLKTLKLENNICYWASTESKLLDLLLNEIKILCWNNFYQFKDFVEHTEHVYKVILPKLIDNIEKNHQDFKQETSIWSSKNLAFFATLVLTSIIVSFITACFMKANGQRFNSIDGESAMSNKYEAIHHPDMKEKEVLNFDENLYSLPLDDNLYCEISKYTEVEYDDSFVTYV